MVVFYLFAVSCCLLFLLIFAIYNWVAYQRIQNLNDFTQPEKKILTGQWIAWLIISISVPVLLVVYLLNLADLYSFFGVNFLELLVTFTLILPLLYVSISAIKHQLYFYTFKGVLGSGVGVMQGEWAIIMGVVQIVMIVPFVILMIR